MKTKLLLIFLLLTTYCLLSTAQVPQGFNYQAVARDGANPVTTPIGVKISIQSASDGGTVFWVEEHLLVQPNSSGLFSLVIGEGNRLDGTVLTFSGIDWAVTPKFIKTEINNGGGYVAMGTSQLWSVPYSTVAGDIEGTLNKLSVKGETTNVEEALFEVKNKDGQTILAVYNEGVRIYVADGSKGSKGGFAIGGFGASKADTPGQQYLIVNRDSIRAYIWDDPLVKSPKGGFAIGGFGSAKTFTNDYMMISPDSARIYINNASSTKGKKGGFAIGGFGATKRTDPQRLLTVSDDSIRMYIDDNSKASKGGFAIGGFGSVKGPFKSFLNVATDATGIVNPAQNKILWYPIKNAFLSGQILIHHPDSIGINSTTTGYESRAKGAYSQAMGYQAIARGASSTSIGDRSEARGANSFAFGQQAIAKNTESYAIGREALAEGYRSFAFGSAGVDSANVATGPAYAHGDYSFAIGQGSESQGKGSMAIGIDNTAIGDYSAAIGYKVIANGYGSTALGYRTSAQAEASTSLGWLTRATGQSSTALGYGSTASGFASFSTGYSSAQGFYSASFGTSTAKGVESLAMGEGSRAIGDMSTSMGYVTKAFGKLSTTMGYYTNANTYGMVAVGRYNDTLRYASDSYNVWYAADPVFAVGNGSSDSKLKNALVVLKNGNVGIGMLKASYPQTILHIKGNAGILNLEGTDHCFVQFYPDGWAGNRKGYFGFPGAAINDINITNEITGGNVVLDPGPGGSVLITDMVSGAGTTLVAGSSGNILKLSSDISLKNNITPLQNSLSKVLKLQGVNFTWKNDIYNLADVGFIAQDVEKVIPELVIKDNNDGLLSVKYANITAFLVESIKEQQSIIEKQQEEISGLKIKVNEIDALKAELEQIKAMLNK